MAGGTTQYDKDIVFYYRLFSRIASFVVLAIGLLVLFGWVVDSIFLKSIRADFVTMKANTAIGFVAGGACLALLVKRTRIRHSLMVSRLLAAMVFALGLIVFMQYIFRWDTGIDDLFFAEDPAAVGTYLPGRMAVNTALGFVVLGISLMFLSFKAISAVVVSQVTGLFIALLSLLPLFGYGFGMDVLYGFADYTEMALHTAIAFLLLSLGIVFANPDRGFMAVITEKGPGGYLSRRLLPLTILTPIVLVWIWIFAERVGWHGLASDPIFFFVIFIGIIVFLIWKISDSINQLDVKRRESEEALHEWQDLMNYIIRHDPNSIAVHDKDLNYVFVSERYLKDYRVKEKDIIGKHHYDVFPDIPQEWRDVHQRALNGEIVSSEESIFHRADGSIDYTRWECRPWHKQDGHIGGIILYTEVITERKKIELKNLETARQLQMVLEHAGDGIFSVDYEGKATLVNKATIKMLGYTEKELLGRVMHEMHHHTKTDGNNYPRNECAIYKAYKEGRTHIVDNEVFWRKDGSSFPVEYVSTPIKQNGNITGAVVSFREVSERKRIEAEIKRLNVRLYLLVSAIKNLSTAHDLEEIRDSMATAARKLADAEGATIVFRQGDCCYYANEDAVSPLWRGQKFPLEKCITGWAMLNKEQAVIKDIYKDDRIPHEAYKSTFVNSLAVFPVNQKEPKAAIGVYWSRQHTPSEEERQLLQTLADAAAIAMENVELLTGLEKRVKIRTEQLEAANKELEAFSYSVSHDLRAPLRAIDGFTRMLLEDHHDMLNEDGKRISGIIRENTMKMAKLIDDLLSFSRLSRKEIQHETIYMEKLVYSIYHEVSSEEIRAKTEFVIDHLPEATGDATMIRQIWANLISNALKFTSKCEKPRIHVYSTHHNDQCVYHIKDNGVGFDMKYVDKIFGVFQRLHSVRDYAGTGVGLAIVQRVVHKHGGTVNAASVAGQGAHFSFSLPANKM